MDNIDASTITLDQINGIYLASFAAKHRMHTLEDLLAYPLSALWKMDGYNLHVQNEIIDLVKKHGLVEALKQY